MAKLDAMRDSRPPPPSRQRGVAVCTGPRSFKRKRKKKIRRNKIDILSATISSIIKQTQRLVTILNNPCPQRVRSSARKPEHKPQRHWQQRNAEQKAKNSGKNKTIR